jgi:UDPglucose 6-dehydrogenase
MHITVVGTGYVGLVTGAGLADLGVTVKCVDVNGDKIRMLHEGRMPFYEPGLEELVRRNRQRGRLEFSSDISDSIANSLVILIAVGTDATIEGNPNLSQLWSAIDLIADSTDGYKLVVIKSTVPVGTAAKLCEQFGQRLGRPLPFDVVSNPEFLREGSAVEDFFHPNRIVIGTSSERAAAIMKDLYRPLYLIQTPFVFTTWECAELIKYAANSFLALKISFMNEMANLCDAIGASADVHVLAHALGLDPRIGSKFLHPGPGFGGYCLPKDARALAQIARCFGQQCRTVEAAIAVNNEQFRRVVEKLRYGLHSLSGKKVAILGLSFKPNTDDVRESRGLKVCEALLEEDLELRLFDPAAMEQARRVLGTDHISYCADAYEAVEGSDAIVFCTEWNEFRNLDLASIMQRMHGNVVVDAKNILDPVKARSLGFRYYGMGRPQPSPNPTIE